MTYAAALYMRLSKDDEGRGESASITAQRQMLRQYAGEHGYAVYGEYADDGVPGTTFDRPGFRKMLGDIERGRVNLVIVKDLSRLGRDYIQAGQYTEVYFPSKGVRCIAVNDGYDSESPYCDIAPFKNVLNEMYARDTSRKIRSALETRMKEGAFVGAFPPYGYIKDPENRHRLVPDGPAAAVVREIFALAAAGALPSEITAGLNGRGVPPPLASRRAKSGQSAANAAAGERWTSSTISKLLRNVVYLGHMAQGKTKKVTFKSDKTVKKPREDWFVVENTHEPLVSAETFALAARYAGRRRGEKSGGFHNAFSGLARCADCGRPMSLAGGRKDAPAKLACGGYKLYGKGTCSNHYMDYQDLWNIVMSTINDQLQLSPAEKSAIVARLEKQMPDRERGAALAELQKRARELEQVLGALYEDRARGLVSGDMAEKLTEKYGRQAQETAGRIARMERMEAAGREAIADRLDKLLDLRPNTSRPAPGLLLRLIEKIEIGQGIRENTGKGPVRRQTVRIYFRFADRRKEKTELCKLNPDTDRACAWALDATRWGSPGAGLSTPPGSGPSPL